MGTRLTVVSNGDEYLNNHKFYMYQPYKNVKSSFDYLFPIMVEQNFMDCTDVYDSAKEYYDTFCVYGCTDELLLSEEQFNEFARLYIEDLINTFGEKAEDLIEEINEICDLSGPKTLYWG